MSSAVIVIDVQNCFLPGGSLSTTNERNSNTLPPTTLAKSIGKFIDAKNPSDIFITQDWHTSGHTSFARANKGEIPIVTQPPNAPGTRLRINAYNLSKFNPSGKRFWGDDNSRTVQALWPEHCVQGTDGAKLAPELESYLQGKDNVTYVYKGDEPGVDSYSAIANALGYPTPHLQDGTPFLNVLKASNLEQVYLTGIARDVCVFWSALDLLNYWILPAYKDGKVIKLSFIYDLTRPVYGVVPSLNKTKGEIESAVKELMSNMGIDASAYDEVFEVVDSNMYSGGRRKTRKNRNTRNNKNSRKNRHVHSAKCRKSCRK